MKCPMRNDAMGNMPECDPECAWRMEYKPMPNGLEMPNTSSCAVAVMASGVDCLYGIRIEVDE